MRYLALNVVVVSAFLLGVTREGYAQRNTRVVVVDSITFEALPAVFVRVKNSTISFLVEPTGIFSVKTKPTDTLQISHIGYHDVNVPLMFEEDAIMVRMRPKVTLLDEAVVSSRRLYPNELNPRVSTPPKTRTLLGSLADPWEYFNKKQKEKRKVAKLMEENDRIKTFMEVITDPSIKEELMEDYALEETEYYNILVRFNQKKFPVIYSNDSEKIIDALHDLFEREAQ